MSDTVTVNKEINTIKQMCQISVIYIFDITFYCKCVLAYTQIHEYARWAAYANNDELCLF